MIEYLPWGKKGSSKLSARRMSMQQFHQRWCDGSVHTARTLAHACSPALAMQIIPRGWSRIEEASHYYLIRHRRHHHHQSHELQSKGKTKRWPLIEETVKWQTALVTSGATAVHWNEAPRNNSFSGSKFGIRVSMLELPVAVFAIMTCDISNEQRLKE